MSELVEISKNPSSIFTRKSICNKNLLEKGKPVSNKSTKIVGIIILISIVSVFSYIGYSYTKLQNNIDSIVNTWEKNRCKPSVLPFTSIISKKMKTDITLSDNIKYCADSYANSKFQYLIAPFVTIIDNIVSSIKDIFKKLDYQKNIIDNISESLLFFKEEIASTLTRYYEKFNALSKEVTIIFFQIFKVFQDIITSLLYLKSLLKDIFNTVSPILIPIQAILDFFCFSPYTKITMSDFSTKRISDIQIGDSIYKGGKVLAVHMFNGKNVQMYSYKNIVVSGYHLVFEESPLRIQDSLYSIPISIEEDTMYCLTTENGYIVSNNNIFGDYMEAQTQKQMNYISNSIIQSISNTSLIKDSDKTWGFHPNTKIETLDGAKNIKNIYVGDKIDKNTIVTGISIIDSSNMDIYTYKNNILSGNVIVYDNGWKYINSISSKTKNTPILYNIFTTSGVLYINNIVFRDCYQTYNKYIHQIIDKNVCTELCI